MVSNAGLYQSALAELRHLLTIPPPSLIGSVNSNNVSSIAIAHAALENLRDSGDVTFLFLRTILEIIDSSFFTTGSHNNKQIVEEELLFHCITGTRQVLLWKWSNKIDYCSYRLKLCIRDYLMLLGNMLETSRTCRLACYSTSVALWKRSWNTSTDTNDIDNTSNLSQQQQMIDTELIQRMQQQVSVSLPVFHTKSDLFQYLETELVDHNHPIQVALYLDSMIGEFVGKSSISYRLPLEFHKNVHKTFEKDNLLQCLHISLKGLELIFNQTNASNGSSTNNSAPSNNDFDLSSMSSIIKLTTNILSWEFGMTAWSASSASSIVLFSRSVLIRLPIQWRASHIVQPDFCSAIFSIHNNLLTSISSNAVLGSNNKDTSLVLNDIRQLLIHLACINGSIFETISHRKNYMSVLCDGTITIMQQSLTILEATKQQQHQHQNDNREPTIVVDCLQILSRVIANFKLSLLIEIPVLTTMLQGMVSIGNQLLRDHISDCERANGDYESIEVYDFRENCINILLECLVLLCDDPWLSYAGTEQSRKDARMSLATVLGPLYEGFVTCRIRMTSIHEKYLIANNDDEFDEIEESIEQVDFDDEMTSIATIGRLHLSSAIQCLSRMFNTIIPQLNSLWDSSTGSNNPVTPDGAALLEVARVLCFNVCYLLTDKNDGETPTIPDSILVACQQPENNGLVNEISSSIQALLMLADAQIKRVALNPTNPLLSPLLATSFLSFLHRWVPAYIFPAEYNTTSQSASSSSSSSSTIQSRNPLVCEWSDPNKASHTLGFCISLCLQYQCYWPLEKTVQDHVNSLLFAIAKRSSTTSPVQSAIVQIPAFLQMVRYNTITAGIRHSAPHDEIEAIIQSKIVGNIELQQNIRLIMGYHRLPYKDKSKIFKALIIACSDTEDSTSCGLLQDILRSIHEALTSFVSSLSNSNQQQAIKYDDIHAQEMACLCVELFVGVVNASEMSIPERIPQFITPYLLQLSGLMKYYSTDLTVCETLLRFFRDYTTHFIATLNKHDSIQLFHSVAEVLQYYSTAHCTNKRIIISKIEASTEEEQAYGDILCAVQLLINLGTKDFIDCCDVPGTAIDSTNKLQSGQVTDMIFFGLQQIIPLMTQGLLQYPTLCKHFFELVSFMMDTYPEKVCTLPLQLFQSLSESLLFGMCHTDAEIGRCSLQGLASVAREHLSSRILTQHLQQHPDLFDVWNRRLLTEVIFQNVVIDRTEAAGMALLPLVAIDINRFSLVIQEINNQISDVRQRDRLNAALSKLLSPEIIAQANASGYEGRANRVKFKVAFDDFVNDIHSFLIIR